MRTMVGKDREKAELIKHLDDDDVEGILDGR